MTLLRDEVLLAAPLGAAPPVGLVEAVVVCLDRAAVLLSVAANVAAGFGGSGGARRLVAEPPL